VHKLTAHGVAVDVSLNSEPEHTTPGGGGVGGGEGFGFGGTGGTGGGRGCGGGEGPGGGGGQFAPEMAYRRLPEHVLETQEPCSKSD